MNMQQAAAAVLAIILVLAGCSREAEPESAIPEGYRNALEKAGGVESQLDQSLQQQERQIEDSGG